MSSWTLRIVYLVAGEVATEIVHTSIFKIADRRTTGVGP